MLPFPLNILHFLWENSLGTSSICFKGLVGSPVNYYRKGEPEVLFVLEFYFKKKNFFFPEIFWAEGALGRMQSSKCRTLFSLCWTLAWFFVYPMLHWKKKCGLTNKRMGSHHNRWLVGWSSQHQVWCGQAWISGGTYQLCDPGCFWNVQWEIH